MQESDSTLGSEPTGSFRGEASTSESSSTPEVLALPTDTILTGRYKIIETLGIGGMGVVYKVFDLELTRTVALKTILPELAATPAALQRFKQEVLLAQKVIHKNVVRIFDIGDHGGTKFITMDFIDGVDLKNLILQRGKLPPQEAAAIIRQASEGLEAAHAAGVVHRDLKPQNIMVQRNGQVLVTDFGIARSNQSRGVTQTGAFLGTPEYMSPEQAQGEEVGARSDIFSMGLIFYEMLTGKLPFHANTMLETMFIRTRERAIPPNEIDQSVPKGANDIVVKCLEIDLDRRYQSVTELLNDLETFDTSKKVAPVIRAKSRLRMVLRYWKWAAGFALVLLVVLAAFMFGNWLTPKPVTMHTPVTVLVADFDNPTGDPLFSGSLETTCETALEEAPFINKYNRSQARTVLGRIQKGATKLDEAAARLVAIREGISVIVAGSIARKGVDYQISVRAIDPAPGSVVATKQVNVSNKERVLGSVGRLIAPIRTALGDTTPESAQLAAAETYTAGSLEASHAYALGQENLGIGKLTEANGYYQQAVQLDPNLGRAYAGLAVAHFNLKKQSEAAEYYRKALTLVNRMSEREKYRTLGGYYIFANNYEQAIETLRKLVLLFPADAAAFTNLSTAYRNVGNMAEAAAASRHAVEITPRNMLRRYNYAANSMSSGDLATAVNEAQRILQQDSGFVYAYMPLALSTALRGDPLKAAGFYGQLEKVSSLGDSLSKMGQADLDIYAGRYQDALQLLLSGIVADEKADHSGELADKLVALAETYNALGRKTEAATAADRAVRTSDLNDGIHFLAARVLVEAGQDSKAQHLAADLEHKLQKSAKSLSLMISGDIALKQKRLSEAIDGYREAQKLNDSWISHVLLGEAYVQARLFPEAFTELDTADKRASEAADLFASNSASLRYLPVLYYWLGRAQEGLGAHDTARETYQRLIAMRQNADSADKLLADAKRRIGQ